MLVQHTCQSGGVLVCSNLTGAGTPCCFHQSVPSPKAFVSSIPLSYLQAKYPTHSKLSNRLWLGKSAGAVEEFVSGSLPREPGAPVVDDWDCLRVRDPCLHRI